MKDKVILSAKSYLDKEGVNYGEVTRCELVDAPKSFSFKKSWVVEFESSCFKNTGVRIDNDHVIVFVDDKTLVATTFPTL